MLRGEIYMVDLGAGFGRELGGVRPVVVVSADFYNLVPYLVIVVIGEDAAATTLKTGVLVAATDSGLSFDLMLFASRLCSLDPTRFTSGPVGTVPPALLGQLVEDLKTCLDIPLPP